MVRPQWHIERTPIFHITSIDNLQNIFKEGFLYSTNHAPCDHTSIANEEIQSRRAEKPVVIEPNGVIHDYVPFYFAPRSPMLFSNCKGNHENAKPQEDIVYIVCNAQNIHSNNLPYVFYDRHAVLATAKPYNDIQHLNSVDWELFFELPLCGQFSKFWQYKVDENHPKWIKRPEVRQAEFLVYEKLDWSFFDYIVTMNKERTSQVESILSSFGVTLDVKTDQTYYF